MIYRKLVETPALWLHEWTHVAVARLFGSTAWVCHEDCTPKGLPHAHIQSEERSAVQTALVCYAPLLIGVCLASVMWAFWGRLSPVVVAQPLITIWAAVILVRYSLLSKHDLLLGY